MEIANDMQFNVPQFIEIEDKIVGPLTLKQFLYLAGGGAILFFAWYFSKLWLFVIIAIPVAALSFALAFLKIHGRPFIHFLTSLIGYLFKPKLYIWKKK